MFSERLIANFSIAFEAVIANKLRSLLTALGIIFGVAAVIAMLAIGNGAQQEIMEQIKLVGVNNIVISPIVEQTEEEIGDALGVQETKKFSPGLTLRDVEGIKKIIPSIAKMSPEILLETYIIKNGIRRSAKLVGVEPAYFELANFELREGRMFNPEQLKKGEPVCIIGKSIQSRFFPTRNTIGQSIKCGKQIVSNMAEIPTIITFASIVLSFGVVATIGLIFGITPARRAAMQDPITSLRHE